MRTLLGWVRDRVDPARLARPSLGAQARSLADVLPYETVLEGERPVVLLDGGSVGVVWELEPVEHERLPDAQLAAWAETLGGIVQQVVDPAVVFQVITEVRPARRIAGPAWRVAPVGPAQKVVAQRLAFMEGRAEADAPAVRAMDRRIYLTLRVEGTALKVARFSWWPESVERAVERQAGAVETLLAQLGEHAQVVEEGLSAVGWRWKRCGGDALLTLLRGQWNDAGMLDGDSAASLPYNPEVRLREQVGRGTVRMAPRAVEVGTDTWEALSWLEQPPHVYHGLFAVLLQLGVPHRCVVNLRPCTRDGDLAVSAQVLKPATDERGVRHREELQMVERRRAYGEQLVCASIHLFVRNEGVSMDRVAGVGLGRSLANRLSVVTRIPFFHEHTFCPALMLLCQPLCYTPETGRLTSRERRVLTGVLGPYLPVFGGYSGTMGGAFAASRTPTQLMLSRAGDPVWLSCRDASTAPHLAVLASTGGGKSFYMVNLMTAELAAHPDSLCFIVDCITSYRVFGEVMGERDGFAFARPPESFPNIFRGAFDDERAQVITGILCTAITLEDETVVITSEHRQLLAAALKKTYRDVRLDASTRFEDDLLVEGTVEGLAVPRLSGVVDNLLPVAEELGLSAEVAKWLRNKLGAFYGAGAYAKFFDQEAVEVAEAATPRVTLFDLERVADDPTMSTLTMVCCIAEILRHIRRPENIGRKGMLVVDEAGVLASGSAELERFIKEAWKTFRKLGYLCAGLTNEVDDYREKPAPRTMWANSPNKVLLRLQATEVEKLGLADERRGIPRLIADPHLRELAGSLEMRRGVYSHGLWISEEGTGTFCYEATGYDYWLAASKPVEVQSFFEACVALGSAWRALVYLAEHHPSGVRDATGEEVAWSAELLEEGGWSAFKAS